MRSSGSVLVGALLLTLGSAAAGAQSSQPHTLFTQAQAREAALRTEMRAGVPETTSLLRRVRTLVGAYEDMAKLFPAAGYSDNALWQGAMLAADAYWTFGEAADRVAALRLFDALTSRFPASTRARQARAHIDRLATSQAATPPSASARVPPSTPVAPAAPAPTAAVPTRAATTTLTSIRRETLPDAVRVTLELEHEVLFQQERIDGPPRVFIDLPATKAANALKDAVLPFDSDVVRQVRVGRQLNARIRVVFDLAQNAGRHSVYTLYSPFRIVVDFERTKGVKTEVARPKETKTVEPLQANAPGAAWTAAPAPAARATGPVAPVTTARGAAVPSAATASLPPVDPLDASAIAPPSANVAGGFSLSRQLGLGISRVVIDPGHGGRDPGAKARGLNEAELVLDVALRLEKLLLKQRGVDVVLTRRTDAYVPLEERTAIANRAGADLFLSIHANSSAVESARGVETYFLNFAPNPEAEAIAARENAGASRTMRHLPDIVRAIAMNNKIDESRDFATMVQRTLYERLHRVDRQVRNLGVKQAPFMVLIDATMPSILAEISFLTNRDEARLLKSERYRQQIAEALFDGITRYQESLKKPAAIAARER